jgi:hypothetical protein
VSFSKIAAHLDRHRDVVKRRNRDVWKVPNRESVWLNEGFFDSWNPTMAYVVGFILADGCLKRDGKWISITQMERPILEDISQAIQHRGRIYREKRGTYRLEFRSTRAWKRLFDLGLVPAKSKVAALPSAPRECLPHLVRGYFDGNGTVYVSDRGKKPMVFASIATGSDVLRSQLATVIENELGITCSFYRYALRITAHKASMRFLLWLYADKGRSLYLKRKHDKFADMVDRRIGWSGCVRRLAQKKAG